MQIEVDIQTILNGTPTYMIGEPVVNYASVFVGEFDANGKTYTLNAVFDLETEVKELVVADENDNIVSTLPEKEKPQVADDLAVFLRDNLDSMADSHLDDWHERYYRKSREQVESDLDISYDFSADIDYVESELNRELTDDEKEYFIEQYTKAIVDNFYIN